MLDPSFPAIDLPTARPGDPTEAAALDYVRGLIHWNAADNAVSAGGAEPLPFRRVGIVGAGIMGTAIAVAHASRGLPTVLVDSNPAALERAGEFLSRTEFIPFPGDIVENGMNSVLRSEVRITDDIAALAECDLVIESIVESAAAKQRLFAAIEPLLAPDAILATNTSAIPLARLGAMLARPGRFGGLHFCHPVEHRPLVEVIAHDRIAPATVRRLTQHARGLGKMPLVIQDGPGFLVNRLLMPYLAQAIAMLTEGTPFAEMERAVREFGMPFGPFEMLDEIGLDTALQGGLVVSEICGDRLADTRLLVSMVKAKQLGRKSGSGFYLYPGRTMNPMVARFIEQWGQSSRPTPSPAIARRLLLPVVSEARMILAEGRIRDRRAIDLAMLFGLGFPMFKGGLLWWADAMKD